MSIRTSKLVIRAIGVGALGLLVVWPTFAHHVPDPLEAAPVAPAASAPEERLTGIVHRVTIDDRVAGMVVQSYSMELADGRSVHLRGPDTGGLETGTRVEVTGRRNGKALFVSRLRQIERLSARAASARDNTPPLQVAGKLAMLHADHFEEGRSDFLFEVHDATSVPTKLAFPVLPVALQSGMRVEVSGRAAADGVGIVPDTVTVLALPPLAAADETKATTTNNVLVILMSFTDSPGAPFTQAQVQAVFAGGAGSNTVAGYFNEVSFGQQLLNPTVTNWLATGSATPAGCDFQTMGTLGRTAATAAGYNIASYQNIVYVFPQVGSCGWLGLAYIGASGVWINGQNSVSVYGHELGHNFGLLHAGSLSCSGVVIGGSCGVTEYGDPFDIMGNRSAMHFNAKQKLNLQWIGSGTVATHTAGSATYVLSPIESAGGATYAIKIPTALSTRTYWLEYRQPIGFDAGLSSFPNNGAQVRVASPFETMCGGCDSWSNDTQLLDMTPATSTFNDAALVVGKSYTDPNYGISISVLSATANTLTVQVSAPGSIAASSTTLASSGTPASAGANVTFTATVTGTAPTGSVAFTADGSTLAGCSAVALAGTSNSKTAACSTSTLASGTHSVVASYGGDVGNSASASASLTQVISAPPPAATTTTAATSVSPATQGMLVTFTATVTGSAPTGGVTFRDGASTLAGCASVALAGTGSARTAACSTNTLSVGSHAIVASYAGDTGNASSSSTSLAQSITAVPPGTLWADDGLPTGAVAGGIGEGWNWITANPAPLSSGLAHQSALAAGLHQHYFFGAAYPLPIGINDTLYVYVYLDPVNPPTEVMLQWHDGAGWEHRAYWGANNVSWGVDGTASRRYMGPRPATGQWVRLAVPAAQVGLDGKSVGGMAFTLYDGRATWDRAGIEAGGSTSLNWVDNALPAGATATCAGEGWNWTSANPTPFSGALAHQSALATGLHQHCFKGASSPMSVAANDTLYAYVYLDPANPPSEVMLQWHDGTSWEHRAFWGANNINWGIDGAAGRRYMGPLPATGQWVRLVVPAAQVGLDGKAVSGMAFTLYDGRATWDYAGK